MKLVVATRLGRFAYLRLACALLVCLLSGPGAAYAQSGYSFFANPTTPTDYRSTTTNGCLACAVLNPQLAADQSAATAATLSVPLGLGSEYLDFRLHLNALVTGGSVAGVVVGSNRPLDLVTLNRVRLRTYRTGISTPVETRNGVNAVEVKVIGTNRYVLEFVTSMGSSFNFDYVELGLSGLDDAIATLDVFYAYGIPQGTVPLGPTITSTFASPAVNSEYADYRTGICVLCDVINPRRAADQDLTTNNYATIQTTVGALGDNRLRLRLNSVATGGSLAGLVISTGSLIDANVLATLTIRTYSRNANGTLVQQDIAGGASLLTLNLLTGNRYYLSFPTTAGHNFEYVELAVGGLVSAVNTVRVYYAFAAPNPAVPLPITLLRFEARATGGGVQLTWATATEKNSAAFVVERTLDPRKAFEAVGAPVPAAGSSDAVRRYSLLDAAAPMGTLYYRLRQVDLDGAAHLSDVITVRTTVRTNEAAIQAWPNPAHDVLQLHLSSATAAEGSATTPVADQVALYNSLGQAVRIYPLGGATDVQLSLIGLRPGHYFIRAGGAARPTMIVVE